MCCFGYKLAKIKDTGFCYIFISDRSARLAFSDFRVVGPFVAVCKNTIQRLQCGTLTPPSAHAKVRVPHSQGILFLSLILFSFVEVSSEFMSLNFYFVYSRNI